MKYGRLLNDKYIGMFVQGHARCSDDVKTKDGNNILCASVSAIAQTAMLGCLTLGSLKELKQTKGYLCFLTPRNDKTEAIIDCAIGGISQIVSQYPENFK